MVIFEVCLFKNHGMGEKRYQLRNEWYWDSQETLMRLRRLNYRGAAIKMKVFPMDVFTWGKLKLRGKTDGKLLEISPLPVM